MLFEKESEMHSEIEREMRTLVDPFFIVFFGLSGSHQPFSGPFLG